MAAYVVRVIESRALLGIYVAPNIATLAELVDETFAPPDCEYRRLPAIGGFAWSGMAPIIPLKFDEGGNLTEGVDFEHAEGLGFTESWYSVLLDCDPDRGTMRPKRGGFACWFTS